MMPRILIVEDDPRIVELLEYNLRRAGFDTESAYDGSAAYESAIACPPDLVLLDLMLPGMDGLEVCRLLKRAPQTADVPVVIVTAKGEELDRIMGLELGADDYIAKPFSPRELVLRVRAVLRRTGLQQATTDSERLDLQGLSIDLGKHQVSGRDGPIELTATEFRLLMLMAHAPGRVFTRSILLDRVWGDEYDGFDRTVDTHISRLRRKLGSHGHLIETVQGIGYRIRE